MWHMGDGWGWWMMFGWVWMVALWGLIIWVVYALVSRTRPEQSDTGPPEPAALEILERRYARGEIDEQEFERKREQLTRPPVSTRGQGRPA